MKLYATKRLSRIALLVQYFCMGFIFSSLLSRFPAIKELYSLSDAQLSFIPFFMSIGSLSIMPFCALFIARYGSKKVSIMGYAFILLLPLLVLMPNLFLLYLCCALYGLSIGLTDVAINANSLIVERAYKRPILGMFHALFYVGMFTGACTSVLFLLNGLSVEWHFALVTVFSLLMFYINRRFFLQETPPKSMDTSFKLMLPKGLLLLIAFIALCGRIIEGGISDWSTVYMNDIVKLTAVYAPLGLAAYSAFMSFGRFFGDRVRAAYGDVQVLLGSCILTAIGLLVMISVPHVVVAIAGLFLCGLGLSCLVPIIYSLAGKQNKVSPGVGLAMVNTISGTGFLFGPSIIGFIADQYSLRVSFVYVFMLAVIMAVLTSVYRAKQKEI